MLLCSLARNPDGTLVRPTAYEINHEQVMNALYASVAVLAVGLLFVIASHRRPATGATAWCLGIALFLMAIHPLWTVPTDGGDCGDLQADCSWLVLGLQGALVGLQLVLRLWRWDRDNPDRVDYDDRCIRDR
jgi:hypothetical protein